MLAKDKIGVGVVTYNRNNLLQKLINSLPIQYLDHIVVVNDGESIGGVDLKGIKLINNKENIGVGKSKNVALRYLIDKDVDHYFLIEDDIYIKDDSVFHKYIQASKETGIQHFNYGLHGLLNIKKDGSPKNRLSINYSEVEIYFYKNCVGAFSYFSKKCIDEIGLFDETYFNALEHIDHTYQIINKKMHPNFWFFADIAESEKYLGDETWSRSQSVIARNDIPPNLKEAQSYFEEKFKIKVSAIPDVWCSEVINQLEYIRKSYGLEKKTIKSLNKKLLKVVYFKEFFLSLKKVFYIN